MRNKSLDGIRGIAVLLVLLYHHALLNMGWAGVDLFFVLSGYLITTILRRTCQDPFFWREFWSKRVTRILPPLLLLILAAGLLTPDVSFLQAMAYMLSLGDVLAYFRRDVESVRLLWSLAVEEHFYILWPFAIHYLARRSLVRLLCVLLVVEPLLRASTSVFHHDWTLVYFLTPFRLDGLSCGALLALAFELPRARALIERWSAPSALGAAILWGVLRRGFGFAFTRDGASSIYNGACYSLVALTSAFLIAYILTHPRSVLTRVLSWKPLIFTGSISYGLYLYQEVIREVMRRHTHFSGKRLFWIDTVITFGVAWLSFVCYERPLLSWGKQYAEGLRRSQITESV